MRSTLMMRVSFNAAARAVALLTAIAGLGACSSDDDGAGSITSFGQQYGEIVCSGLVKCCAAAGQNASKSQCMEFFRYQQSETEAGVESGKFTFDAEAAGECLEAARGVSNFCGGDMPEACDRVMQGTAAADARCDQDNECAIPPGGIATCNYSEEAEYGRCEQTVRGKVGDACQQTCEDLGGGSWSCSGTGGDPENGIKIACYRNDNLICDFQTTKCVALGAAGENCSFDGDCGRGLFCLSGSGSSTCAPLGAAGAACESNDACESDYCDPSNQCAVPLALGATCDANAERDPCGAGSRCSEEGKCAPQGVFGGGDPSALICGLISR